MTEAIRIQKDVPTANWVSNSWIRQNSSQLIRPSPHSQLKSRTSKRKTLDKFSCRLTASALPGAELAIEYLYSKYIKNLSVHTIRQTGGVVLSFLQFLHDGGTTILTLTRRDVGSFVEYEQDRGLRPVSIIGYLRALYAFVAYLVKEEVLPQEIMRRKIRIQEPETLPKAIPQEDIQLLLDAIASVRDRALILLLLRTGMRIGELLETQINDIVLSDRKIIIYLGSKNYQGRAVYFSEDAETALKHWLRLRDNKQKYLFYGSRKEKFSYSAAWSVMRKTLERAGLVHKKYSLHSLRHYVESGIMGSVFW
jgi:integrase/recombinase XerD